MSFARCARRLRRQGSRQLHCAGPRSVVRSRSPVSAAEDHHLLAAHLSPLPGRRGGPGDRCRLGPQSDMITSAAFLLPESPSAAGPPPAPCPPPRCRLVPRTYGTRRPAVLSCPVLSGLIKPVSAGEPEAEVPRSGPETDGPVSAAAGSWWFPAPAARCLSQTCD